MATYVFPPVFDISGKRIQPVKFKMAPNSVFAILLRSSWWISFAVGAVIVVLCLALLPKEIRFVGSAGSLPFFVIGLLAAKRQWSEPSTSQSDAILARATTMPAKDLQQWLQAAWQAEGYTATISKAAAAAADMELQRNGQTTLVLTKRSKAAVHGVEPLRALQTAAAAQGANAAYVVLQGELSENARLFARDNNITVLQNKELVALLDKAPKA